MSIIGKTLAHYQITSELGKGGMGEVYQATDTKLGRDVAIKVLPEEFAQDTDRVARFQREAKLLASLNHSNIAAIHGLEEVDSTNFLVMELVEGQTLDDRIKSGAIPVEDALKLALQIAEALEAAHEKGVIHRDLKPANIKVTPDGKVKVLDFGLAKALAGEKADLNLSNSPTLSVAATQQGVILGTAAYMSPEQARGKEVDKRADIWAFGVVLYEMLTGKQLFASDTVSDTLASVLTREPDFSILPADIHPNIGKLLRRCLQKDPEKRLRDAADASLEIEEAFDDPYFTKILPTEPPVRRRLRQILFGSLLLITGLVIGWGTGILKTPEPTIPSPMARLALGMPSQTHLFLESYSYPLNMALSQDGSRIAFIAQHGDGTSRLYLRSMDDPQAKVVPDSENATLPFFSPDGEWVAYCANNSLFKVSVEGPVPREIGKLPFSPRGAAWGADEIIYLGGANRGLYRMPANGGEAVEITHPDIDHGEQYHAWPDVMPDGKHLLFTAVRADGYDIGALSIKTGEWHILEQTDGAGQPRYLNSGHLVFFRGGGLFAAPFDVSSMAFSGPAVLVMENISWKFDAGLYVGRFYVSRSGSLLYLPASGNEEQSKLVLVDRSGTEEALPTPIGRYYSRPVFSPDGKQITYDRFVRKAVDVWTFDLERRTENRLTSQDDNIMPVWNSDGTRIIFSKFRSGTASFDLYWAPAIGGARPELLKELDNDQFGIDASRDGRFVAFGWQKPGTGEDIYLLHLDEGKATTPFLTELSGESFPAFSPDTRFLAYVSDRTGRSEIYVRSVSGNEDFVPISNGGGYSVRWSPVKDELFYLAGDKMMVVPFSTSSQFRAGKPEVVFQGHYNALFDVAPDGQHFLMVKPSEQEPVTHIQVFLNWFEKLKKRVKVD